MRAARVLDSHRGQEHNGTMRRSDLIKRIPRNLGLKIISVLIAVGLWVFVNAGQRNAVETLPVPISYRLIPTGLVIINRPPDFVKIEIAGPRTLLSLLDPERLTVKLNLNGVSPGQSDFKITPAMFNLPRQTTVTRISPDDITLDIDRIVSRQVPVHLAISGQVQAGYKVGSVEVMPATVEASGPSRYVNALQRVDTAPFEVQGLTGDVDRPVELAAVPEPVRLLPEKVDAHVIVSQQIADKEFRGVAVQVRDTNYKVRIEPPKASITVRGPVLKLAGLDPAGMVYVDAKNRSPGSHDLPLQVDLPEGMQLVHQVPQKVRIRVYREKRVSTAGGPAS
jgi:YbbR domain-containing protein